MESQINIKYRKFDNIENLPSAYQTLVSHAKDACNFSYAPYSKFKVGAALLLSNGTIIQGANQENASFSLTICAERTALGSASMQYPTVDIKCIAITYISESIKDLLAILSPCGACRQHILEYQNRQNKPIAILMIAPNGNAILVDDITQLLPFAFTGDTLPL